MAMPIFSWGIWWSSMTFLREFHCFNLTFRKPTSVVQRVLDTLGSKSHTGKTRNMSRRLSSTGLKRAQFRCARCYLDPCYFRNLIRWKWWTIFNTSLQGGPVSPLGFFGEKAGGTEVDQVRVELVGYPSGNRVKIVHSQMGKFLHRSTYNIYIYIIYNYITFGFSFFFLLLQVPIGIPNPIFFFVSSLVHMWSWDDSLDTTSEVSKKFEDRCTKKDGFRCGCR